MLNSGPRQRHAVRGRGLVFFQETALFDADHHECFSVPVNDLICNNLFLACICSRKRCLRPCSFKQSCFAQTNELSYHRFAFGKRELAFENLRINQFNMIK